MKTIFLKLTTDPESEQVVEGTKYRVLWEKCTILQEYVPWVHIHYHNQTHIYSNPKSYRENDVRKICSQAVPHAEPVQHNVLHTVQVHPLDGSQAKPHRGNVLHKLL